MTNPAHPIAESLAAAEAQWQEISDRTAFHRADGCVEVVEAALGLGDSIRKSEAQWRALRLKNIGYARHIEVLRLLPRPAVISALGLSESGYRRRLAELASHLREAGMHAEAANLRVDAFGDPAA